MINVTQNAFRAPNIIAPISDDSRSRGCSCAMVIKERSSSDT
jgi:hypothetical protein